MAAPYRSGAHAFRDRCRATSLTLLSTTNTAPPDASLAPGQVNIWFDSTAGAIKVMFKAKDAAGAVTTGQLN